MPALMSRPMSEAMHWQSVLGGACVASLFVLFLLGLLVHRRSKKHNNYPQLLNASHSLAVKNALSKGPSGVRGSVSALQSPLSSTASTPSPVTPFSTLLEERTRRLSPSELPLERGRVEVTLAYDPLALSLQVGVMSCRDLCQLCVSPTGQCLLDPYVKLQLLPDRQHRVKTRIVRATNCPVFDEHFTLYGVSGEELAASTLHVQVCAFDRYSRDAIVGETCYALTDAALLLNQSKSLTLPLGPENFLASKGELLLSLTYHAALNNLTLVVVKGRGLSGTPDPYVKVTLRTKEGKRLIKKRTHVRRAAKNPVFNESFVLELPDTKLKNAVIDVQMMHHHGTHSQCLGRLLLNESDAHLLDAIHASDKQLAQWHPLE